MKCPVLASCNPQAQPGVLFPVEEVRRMLWYPLRIGRHCPMPLLLLES